MTGPTKEKQYQSVPVGTTLAEKMVKPKIIIVGGGPAPGPFSYFDKGSMAVVGKGFAVLQTGKVQVSGFPAWLTWAAVHLQFLATSEPPFDRFSAMGMDLRDRTERRPADCESPWNGSCEAYSGRQHQTGICRQVESLNDTTILVES